MMKLYYYEVNLFNDDAVIHEGHMSAINLNDARKQIAEKHSLIYLRHSEYLREGESYQIYVFDMEF